MRKLLVVVLLTCIVSSCFLYASATSEQTQLNDTLKESVSENLNLTLLKQAAKNRSIQCFDVNNQGWFAIGFSNNVIHIYNQNGIFQYGYQFHCDGDYGIAFEGKNLLIYLVRGEVCAAFDPSGQCIYATNIPFSNYIRDDVIYKTTKTIGDVNYFLERDAGVTSGNFSRLIAIDILKNKTVLYDAGPESISDIIGDYFLIFSILGLMALGAVAVVKNSSAYDGDD